jgi:hypothetical protein
LVDKLRLCTNRFPRIAFSDFRAVLAGGGIPVKLHHSILDLKASLSDGNGAPRRPSIVERLDDFFAQDRPDFWDFFGNRERPKDLSSDRYSSLEELRARLGEIRASPAQQSTPKRPARRGDSRRKLIVACFSVSVLILILAAGMVFFFSQAVRKTEPVVSSSVTAAQVSAPSEVEPRREATTDSGTSATQVPSGDSDSQPRVQSQPSISAPPGPQEKVKGPADNGPRRVPTAVGELTPRAAPPQVAAPQKVARREEEPRRPVAVDEVTVPDGQAGGASSAIVSEPPRTAPAPAPQVQAPAEPPAGTANHSTSAETASGRASEQGSGSIGVWGASEGNSGVRITQIAADGPAAQAGLKVGDIITELDGIPVKMAQILDAEIALRKLGSKIRISYLRNSTPGDVTVTVGKHVTP